MTGIQDHKPPFHLRVDDSIVLRLLVEADAPVLFELVTANREQLRQHLSWVENTKTRADVERAIRFALRLYHKDEGMQAGLWFEGRLAGVISYNYIDQQRTEIGYWLGAAFQGQGIMTRACRALTAYAFDVMEVQRVEIRCSVENLKSRAIPERLGFIVEGTVPQLDWNADHYVDVVVYAMTAGVWSAR